MKKTGFILSVICVGLLTGCVSGPSIEVLESNSDETLVGLYRLRALDPLRIELLGIPEEKGIDMTIDERGDITLPYLDDSIKAAGMTTSELEREIQQIYTSRQIYRSITVNVTTLAKIYYVEGEVKRPQEYSLSRRITLLQAIAAASGYTEYANRKNITITRQGRVFRFNGKDIEKNPELDVPVEAGDRIKVHRSFY
jgi:polysaccharide export outer membrane protein